MLTLIRNENREVNLIASFSPVYNLIGHGSFLYFRRRTLQRKAQEAQVSNEEQEEMMRNLERRETEYMRLQRRKVGIDDFEQLTVIGKGAFGEVYKKNLYCIFTP